MRFTWILYLVYMFDSFVSCKNRKIIAFIHKLKQCTENFLPALLTNIFFHICNSTASHSNWHHWKTKRKRTEILKDSYFTMVHSNLKFIVIASSLICCSIEMRSTQSINVMLSHYNKTAPNRALNRLDMQIMRNFGKMANLRIEFTVANESLNTVFNAKNRFRKFWQLAEYM